MTAKETSLKYFTPDGIRGLEQRDKTRILMPDLALKVGYIIGIRYWQERRQRVVVGKSTMRHGYGIEPALQAGLAASGMSPHLLGPAPTPSVSMHVRSLRARFGIMISVLNRSHDQIGIKLFGQDGLEISAEEQAAIDAMLDMDLSGHLDKDREWGKAIRVDGPEQRYIEFVKKTLSTGFAFDGLRVVVDCANGALYKIAPAALDELGAEVVPIGVDPKGFNVNQNCGFRDGRILAHEVHYVRADIGFAFNGDGSDFVVMTEANHEKTERVLTRTEVDLLLEYNRKECDKAAELNGSAEGDALMKAFQILAALQRSKKTLSKLVDSLTPQSIRAVA